MTQQFSRYDHKLFNLIEILHGSDNGGVSGFQIDQLTDFEAFIKYRIENWQEPSTSYDLLVKALCCNTLENIRASRVYFDMAQTIRTMGMNPDVDVD